jgi:hypothetical protein
LNKVHITTAEKPNTEPTDSRIHLRHQQRHRQRDEAEFDGEGEDVADVDQRQEIGIDRREHHQFDDQKDQGSEFGRGDEALQRGSDFAWMSASWGVSPRRIAGCHLGRDYFAPMILS